MENKFTIELKVGIFVTFAILSILLFILIQTRLGKWTGYEIGVMFDYVSGLEIGSPVRVSGVRVGEVRKIEILYEEKPKILVKLKITPGVKIGKNSKITIKTLGIIGEKYIEIIPSADKEFIKKGEIVQGENPLSVDKIANMGEEIATNLNKILSDISKLTGDKKIQDEIKNILSESNTALKKINSSFDKISVLVDELKETNKNINLFIETNSPELKKVLENTDNFLMVSKKGIEETLNDIRNFLEIKDKIEETMKSFSETSNEFKLVSSEIKEFLEKIQTEGLIAKIMKEERLIEDIKEEIGIIKDATLKFKETTFKIGETTENFKKSLENLNYILENLKTDRGTIGKFLYRDELYNEIYDFVKDIKAHPWKLFFKTK